MKEAFGDNEDEEGEEEGEESVAETTYEHLVSRALR
jgi:hypothetical protein